ncbi:octanoyl-[acyl-carrier-protein]:protein N-octanoyltransferase LIPT2, mitochondrial-like [Sycon ciliatum]|uniref:octanoyl-[acyl-carrier-protein]:protein N-octanoyltransferase LIPT2, mitochondrial-like n=1 Tax=Sycon ciliatum TaxID=27933 RepID=UPI0020A88116|eukprot:scpid37070/ scgid15177/ Putative lipoyltransferase 2, mitochondrial; Lipoate-protein ligase B; Lipoyl/octanoyl transferase; Octanoyl-[acyl-carrier-protein]-protein N-octanoyltransferase
MASATRPMVLIRNLARINYDQALGIQESMVNKVIGEMGQSSACDTKTQNTLLLCEHNPVYTNGRRAKDLDNEQLRNRFKDIGADYFQVDRGGLITFHGPGQLVCYPIFNLHQFKPSLKWYVHTLEEVIIETCRKFGVETRRTPDTGIWVGNNKVCAMGIQSTRYVTMHGLALNCNTDLKWFTNIVPCGLHGKGVTSLTELTGKEVTIEDAMEPFLSSFKSVFQCQLIKDDDSGKNS